MICIKMSLLDLTLFISPSSNTPFISSVNSSVNSFASLPSLPSNSPFKCSCKTSGLGNLKPPIPSLVSSLSFALPLVSLPLSNALANASFIPSIVSLKWFSLNSKSVSSVFLSVDEKNWLIPSMVSAIFSCKSFSFIAEKMSAASPKSAASLTDPNTVINNNCKYFQIEVLVFSLIPSQLNNSLKSTFGKNITFNLESGLKMSALVYITSKNRSGKTAKQCLNNFSYSASSAVNHIDHIKEYSG